KHILIQFIKTSAVILHTILYFKNVFP
ncbi:hypothetical protein EHRUM3_07300, partial [Ehrlichia ruminantium]